MRKLFGFLMGLMLLTISAYAQTKEAAGKVTDSRDGSPLSGVTVSVKNSTSSAVTAADGTFKFTVPESAETLIFSYVGYQVNEIPYNTLVNTSLQVSEKSLNEVIVVVYGTRTRREVTGSVAKVSAKEIANTPATSFESALQGRAAGVFVEQ